MTMHFAPLSTHLRVGDSAELKFLFIPEFLAATALDPSGQVAVA